LADVGVFGQQFGRLGNQRLGDLTGEMCSASRDAIGSATGT
jgi:hypothetical protein